MTLLLLGDDTGNNSDNSNDNNVENYIIIHCYQ